MMVYTLIMFLCTSIIYIWNEKKEKEKQMELVSNLTAQIAKYEPTPTPTNSPTPTPTATPTPFPTPTPICEISNQQFYDECVARGMVNPPSEEHITKEIGGYMGESGRETYYNLKMDICVSYMRELGYDEEQYPYWIRSDGAKMLGNYVMVAANWKIRPKGTIIPTSLGDGIVVDTGEFVVDYPYGVDIAVDW